MLLDLFPYVKPPDTFFLAFYTHSGIWLHQIEILGVNHE